MHYLAISTIARGEAPYVKEWLAYHLGIGCDHVYLYDNDPSVNMAELVKEFGDKVTVAKVEGDVQQCATIERSLFEHKNDTRFMAMIDVDEFLVPLKTDNLKKFLEPYEQYSAVCPHWRLFGSSGQQRHESGGVLERFTKRATEVDRHVKSIVDPRRTFRWVTVHKYTHPTPAVDEHFNPIPEQESRPEPATADLIQLNHYVTKSYDECLERRNRPRADIAAYHQMPEFFHAHDRNDVEDLRALELYRELQKRD